MKGKSIKSFGLIGAGRMGSALVHGLLRAGLLKPEQVSASDCRPSALDPLRQQWNIRITGSNADVARDSEIVLIAVKPDVVRGVLEEIRPCIDQSKLIISIAAGVTLGTIEGVLGPDCRVVRVMPNTPCLVGAGASVFSLGARATAEDARRVQGIFETVGIAMELGEKHLDAVTALSASGPAYIFLLIEALSDGGVKMGIPRHVATELAAQTVWGAAKMVLETKRHPAELKDQVTSPGGTTIAGLEALEARAFRAALIEAVEAATRRAGELGRQTGAE